MIVKKSTKQYTVSSRLAKNEFLKLHKTAKKFDITISRLIEIIVSAWYEEKEKE
jgi:hypothetical protein